MKTYIQLLLIALFVPVLSACDQEDDVIDIFTGKTWYMTYIAVEGRTTSGKETRMQEKRVLRPLQEIITL